MAVVIGQIVTETVMGAVTDAAVEGATRLGDDEVDMIVRRATERVLDTLRREWDV